MGHRRLDRRAPRARVWAALFALGTAVVCARSQPAEPAGAWWAGRTTAVREVLGQLAQLEGTPLARTARALADALPDCERVGVHAPDGDAAALAQTARCLAPDDPLERIRRAADADLVFALGSGHAPVVRGTLTLEHGALAIDLRWHAAPDRGALALLVPGTAPAGRDRLASAGRLVSLRVRPRDGIDLAALVPAGSQADRLFRLKSSLFASAVLDGTWEGAVYLPERAGGMPGVALALGFSLHDPAVSAIEKFIADLQQTWPVHREALTLPAGAGACLPDLNVLPDLAPCYVATGDALVVGWNPASLAHALAATDVSPAHGDEPGRLDVDLALIQRADDLVARALPDAPAPTRWPWARVVASGGERDGALALHVMLLPPPAPSAS